MNECCGRCRYNRYLKKDGSGQGDFACMNDESEYFGVETLYDDACEEWEEKD